MWRKLAMDLITTDPAYRAGDYTVQPVGLKGAMAIQAIAGSTPLPYQLQYPTRDAADAAAQGQIARLMEHADANDTVYALAASRNYDPSRELERIIAPVAWVNSADDFINPPELGIAERQVKRMPNARFTLIPIGPNTRGHGSHTVAVLWDDQLKALLERSEAPGR
jgi:homoserine O-acetyltransferase